MEEVDQASGSVDLILIRKGMVVALLCCVSVEKYVLHIWMHILFDRFHMGLLMLSFPGYSEHGQCAVSQGVLT